MNPIDSVACMKVFYRFLIEYALLFRTYSFGMSELVSITLNKPDHL